MPTKLFFLSGYNVQLYFDIYVTILTQIKVWGEREKMKYEKTSHGGGVRVQI